MNRYSLSLHWISLKLIWMTLWKQVFKYGRNLEIVLCSLVLSEFGQIFELLLLTESSMDLSETYTNDTMDIDPKIYEARIGKFVRCSPVCPNWDKLGQIFESLLLPEFTMDFFETYIDETMGKGPQSNTAGILNLSSVPRLCPILSKLGQMFESLLLPDFSMDFFETYIDETMGKGP